MSYATLRDGIETAIGTVSNAGNVHDYWRYSTDPKTFGAQHQITIAGTHQIRTWLVQLTGITPVEESAFAEQTLLYRFELYGYRSLNDAAATEKEFIALAEAVMRAVMQKSTFGASGAQVYSTSITGVTFDHAQFAETLCHRARIGLSIEIDYAQGWS